MVSEQTNVPFALQDIDKTLWSCIWMCLKDLSYYQVNAQNSKRNMSLSCCDVCIGEYDNGCL